ncbi:16S rRNA (uracil(1498)-N(3))-methyltransferase [Mesoterricola silvestris]|uniref:Ribosomal RNA small subunit methyltransferase E n=1 Tax=Mesoterricola silvestris TaxID=2927979 RepID=A0AA48GQU3_9BACT|nr:16S rRNA (uracil(1498)-N(3))-methyltransferase [Mesoterricola silvestris]BDU74020.1 ribosomal RNA small subunit methyltransferase E [Mesoterricola silvestris]
MNLVLLREEDFTAPGRARLTGRRQRHVLEVHRAEVGDELVVGLLGGSVGRGRVTSLEDGLHLEVVLDQPPPPKLPLTLVLALPRPKVLNRTLAAATSLGVASIYLVNAWKVEKSYWKSPRLSEENLLEQRILGLEQARDTVLPALHLRRLLRPFAEEELAGIVQGTTALLAHPGVPGPCPRDAGGPVVLVIGPEGGFIPAEVELLSRSGCRPVNLGERILRVETAVAALTGRLF